MNPIKVLAAHLLLISLSPVFLAVLLWWLLEDWLAGREVGGSQY